MYISRALSAYADSASWTSDFTLSVQGFCSAHRTLYFTFRVERAPIYHFGASEGLVRLIPHRQVVPEMHFDFAVIAATGGVSTPVITYSSE